jgi:uncharacterized protein
MLHRTLGRAGPEVSILGFGCMRLPVLDGRHDRIDEALATRMLHHGIDAGVNYVDTAYPYHGGTHNPAGNSEVFVGRALQGGYRERVLLATKLPSWLVHTRADMDKFLDVQLERLRTDHIDCYLLHGLNAGSWERLRALGVLPFLDRALADGRIRYAGFSFHDDAAVFPGIVDAYDWTFCQIQYNYMDVDYQAGQAGLRYAAERGLGVIIMEPLKGGWLAQRVPDEVKAIWRAAPVARSPAEWALRFVWDEPGVSMLLSGMTAMEHVIENLRVAADGHPRSLSAQEQAVIRQARDVYRSRMRADCTGCRYCMPCPSGVDIPYILEVLNDAYLYEDVPGAKVLYGMQGGAGAAGCTECGECEEACPQGLPISDLVAEARRLFES